MPILIVLVIVAQDFSSFWVDQVHAGTNRTHHGLIFPVVASDRFVGDPTLNA